MSATAPELDDISALDTGAPVSVDNVPDGSTDVGTNQSSRKARIFEKTGKQASPAQIRDLRLLTKFVKDFDLDVKQRDIDEYLGFKERTSRRLRKEKTRSELVAEGKIEKRNRIDKPRKPRESKASKAEHLVENPEDNLQKDKIATSQPTTAALPNGYVEGWQDGMDLAFAFP